MKRLPPWKRRQLADSLWKICFRLQKMGELLEDTPDGESDAVDETAGDSLVDAGMAVQSAIFSLCPDELRKALEAEP